MALKYTFISIFLSKYVYTTKFVYKSVCYVYKGIQHLELKLSIHQTIYNCWSYILAMLQI